MIIILVFLLISKLPNLINFRNKTKNKKLYNKNFFFDKKLIFDMKFFKAILIFSLATSEFDIYYKRNVVLLFLEHIGFLHLVAISVSDTSPLSNHCSVSWFDKLLRDIFTINLKRPFSRLLFNKLIDFN